MALVAAIAACALPAPAGAAIVGWGFNGKGELGTGVKTRPHVPVEGPAALAGASQVVATFFSSYALMPDGSVWGWGDGTFGELGNGERKSQLAPVRVKGLTGVKQIAAGGGHVIALLGNGHVATWGGNAFGQLGIGTAGGPGQNSSVPVFPAITNAVSVAAGGGDDAAVLADGTVLAWGENTNGQLGDGTSVEKDVPTPVQGLAGVREVAIGGLSSHGGHMLALLSDGTVRAVGSNVHGELGNGTLAPSTTPVAVPGLSGVAAVSASIDHSMALLPNGTIYAWGGDTEGQLGIRATITCHRTSRCVPAPTRIGLSGTAIAAGRGYSLVISGGQVYAFGANAVLQLGQPGPARMRPVAVPGLSHVTSVSASEMHSLALGALG